MQRKIKLAGRRTRAFFLLLLLLFSLGSDSWLPVLFGGSFVGYAAVFPSAEIYGQSGIVMDVDTGAVIYNKNMDQQMYPASITKVLTALVVLEHAKLTDKLTFSHDAVYNVDRGSSNAGIDEGDVLTVEACLNALLLKSANEAANALAEHVAGSREAFARLMNEKAKQLGCTGSNFVNPSGLHDPNHYTTAHDMALIGAAAMENESFRKIEENRSYSLPATKKNPQGLTLYMEHKMLLKNTAFYDSRVVAGKTGFTRDAGNTLITMAEAEGRRFVVVVMGDKNPAHYHDTGTLLSLAFDQTENREVPKKFYDTEVLRERLLKNTVVSPDCKASDLHVRSDQRVTVPKGADLANLQLTLEYNLPGDAPSGSIAMLRYQLEGDLVGYYFLWKDPSISVLLSEAPAGAKVAFAISGFTLLLILGFVLFGGGAGLFVKGVHDEHKRTRKLREKRKERLNELRLSEEEFRELCEKRKNKRAEKKRKPENHPK